MIQELIDRAAGARRSYLELERTAAAVDDNELTLRIDCARLALLDVVDRAAQLAAGHLEESA